MLDFCRPCRRTLRNASFSHACGSLLWFLCTRTTSNHSYKLADGYCFALLNQDTLKHTTVVRLKLHIGLVRFNFDQDITLFDGITLMLEPSGNRTFLHSITEPRHIPFSHDLSAFLKVSKLGSSFLIKHLQTHSITARILPCSLFSLLVYFVVDRTSYRIV